MSFAQKYSRKNQPVIRSIDAVHFVMIWNYGLLDYFLAGSLLYRDWSISGTGCLATKGDGGGKSDA
jgi:hypothetical protein